MALSSDPECSKSADAESGMPDLGEAAALIAERFDRCGVLAMLLLDA